MYTRAAQLGARAVWVWVRAGTDQLIVRRGAREMDAANKNVCAARDCSRCVCHIQCGVQFEFEWHVSTSACLTCTFRSLALRESNVECVRWTSLEIRMSVALGRSVTACCLIVHKLTKSTSSSTCEYVYRVHSQSQSESIIILILYIINYII